MFVKIKENCNELVKKFDSISLERKAILGKIANFMQEKKNSNLPINLIYVCTHNSRRSHFGQVWSQVAANYFGILGVKSFSGGTEATAFNTNAINALNSQGFNIVKEDDSTNPKYQVCFGDDDFTSCFSKVYDHESNPNNNFAAIMTCSDAEENCPFIPGVELRIATTYDDPKVFDGTELQAEKYLERSNQIATETLYVFSLIK